NGQAEVSTAVGTVLIEWKHRDRVLQADQLVDDTLASVGPEPGTTYTLRAYLNDVLVDEQSGLAGTSVVWEPAGAGAARVELFAVRDGLESWQSQIREFTIGGVLTADSGDLITTESGQP